MEAHQQKSTFGVKVFGAAPDASMCILYLVFFRLASAPEGL